MLNKFLYWTANDFQEFGTNRAFIKTCIIVGLFKWCGLSFHMVWVWGTHFLFLLNGFLLWNPPPASSVPSLGGLGPSGGLPVRAGGDARHCIVCLATRVVGSLFEGEEVATRKPWGTRMWSPHPGNRAWLKCSNAPGNFSKSSCYTAFPSTILITCVLCFT